MSKPTVVIISVLLFGAIIAMMGNVFQDTTTAYGIEKDGFDYSKYQSINKSLSITNEITEQYDNVQASPFEAFIAIANSAFGLVKLIGNSLPVINDVMRALSGDLSINAVWVLTGIAVLAIFFIGLVVTIFVRWPS